MLRSAPVSRPTRRRRVHARPSFGASPSSTGPVPDLEVRTATADDREQVAPLLDDALGRLRTLRGGETLLSELGVAEDTSADFLASVLCGGAEPQVETLVATLDGAVVGFAVSV